MAIPLIAALGSLPATSAVLSVGRPLQVAPGDWRPGQLLLRGLQVGTFEGGANAVADGQVLPGWLPDAPAAVPAPEQRTRLWAQLASGSGGGVAALEGLDIVSADPSVAEARVQLEVSSSAVQAAVGASLPPLVADVTYACHRAGDARLVVRYRFQDARLAPLELAMVKRCAADPPAGVSLGTQPGLPPDVVRDGASQWTLPTALQRVVPAETAQLELFWQAGDAAQSAVQAIAAPFAVVTRLASREETEDEQHVQQVGQPEVRRWRGRLLERTREELRLKHGGSWSLPQASASAQSLLRVGFGGALAAGGRLVAGEPSPGGAELAVELQCLEVGMALVEVQVTPLPAYQPHRPATVAFVKHCGWTALDGVDVFTPGARGPLEADVVREGVVLRDLPALGAENATTTVYWDTLRRGLGPPDATRVDCGDAAVANASVRISPQSGGLSGSLQFLFACRSTGSVRCAVRFGWRLYRGPIVHVSKVCGPPLASGAARSLLQRRQQPAPPAPPALPKLPVLCYGSTSHLDSAEMEVPPDASKVTCTFFPNSSVGLLAARVTVANPHIVKAVSSGGLALGGEVDPLTGGDIELDLSCAQSGTSRIEVSLPPRPGHNEAPLSFSFSKRCEVSRFQSQPYLAALFVYGGLLLASLAVVVGLLGHFRGSHGKR